MSVPEYRHQSIKLNYAFTEVSNILYFLFALSSFIVSYIYSLLLFLKYLLVSYFTMFRLSVY